jgi:hypothetical protein
MKRIAMMVALALLAGTGWARADNDPLADARQGRVQCYTPDAARKTCAAMAAYVFSPDGRITNPAVVLVGAQPVTLMRVTAPVEIKAGAVCGVPRAEDIDGAAIQVAGRQLTPEEAAPIKAQIETAFAARNGKEICTTYVPNGDRLSAQVTVDGVPEPKMSATVIWVAREDGYTVAP